MNGQADDNIRAFGEYWDRRKALTCVLFADVQGSASLKDSSPIYGLYLIREFFRLVKRTALEYNGKIVKYLGDGVLIRFDGDNGPTDAVNSAIAMHEACKDKNSQGDLHTEMCFNIGINAGYVIDLDGDDPHGKTVDIAARLTSLARGGQILINANLLDMIRVADLHSLFQQNNEKEADFLLSEAEVRKLKGTGDVNVVEVRPFGVFKGIQWPRESLIEWKELHVLLTGILDSKDDVRERIVGCLRSRSLAKARSRWRDLRELERSVYHSLTHNIDQWSFVTSDRESREYIDLMAVLYDLVTALLSETNLASSDAEARAGARDKVDGAIDDWYRCVVNYQQHADNQIRKFLLTS